MCNNKYVFLVLVGILFASCDARKSEDEVFLTQIILTTKRMNVGDNLGRIISLMSIDDYLVITERNFNTQAQLINKKTRESFLFAQIGEGPGSFIQSSDIMQIGDRRFAIFDAQRRRIFGFSIDSIVEKGQNSQPEVLVDEVSSFPLTIGRLSDQKYVASGLTNDLERLILLDSNGEVVSRVGSLPAKRHHQIRGFTHSFAYWGRLITTNQKKNRAAIATNYAGIIQIYDFSTSEAQLISEHIFFLADYREEAGQFRPTPRTRWGYLSIASNDKHIFALFSGRYQADRANPGAFLRSNRVHVFDWDGNPVALLLLDTEVNLIAVSCTHLYGYSDNYEDIVYAEIRSIEAILKICKISKPY